MTTPMVVMFAVVLLFLGWATWFAYQKSIEDEVRYYREGWDAFLKGKSRDDCPYQSPHKRYHWKDGWDESHDINLETGGWEPSE